MLANVIAIVVFMSGAFVVSKSRKRLDTVDSAWGPAFVITASIVAGYTLQWRSLLIVVLVDIWALRLTSHLVQRARSRAEDPRYKELSKKWKGNFWLRAYFSIFLLQAALVWIISLPVVLAAGKSVHGALAFAVAGTALWAAGFVTEAVADKQLARFVAERSRKSEVMQSGLWHYSRHPNYFGEILQWFGIGVIACGARYGFIGLLGPLVLVLTIIFISGIPPVEKRRAGNLDYQEYKRRVSPLVPWPPKD